MRKIDLYLQFIEHSKQKDLDAMLALMTEDVVVHPAVGMVGALRGIDAIRPWLEGTLAHTADSQWRVVDSLESDDTLFVEGIEEHHTTDGQHFVVPYAGVYKFRGDKICAWRDYLHGKLVQPKKGGEPIKDHVLELAARPPLTETVSKA